MRRVAFERGATAAEADASAAVAVAAGPVLGLLTTGDRAAADRTIDPVAEWLLERRSWEQATPPAGGLAGGAGSG